MAKRRRKRRFGIAGNGCAASRQPLLPFRDAAIALLRWFELAGLNGVIIGGVAVSLLARARQTRDLDALAVTADGRDDWPALFRAARQAGLEPRAANPVAFAEQTRMMLLSHAATGTDLDVSIGALPFEHEIVARAKPTPVAGLQVPLPTPEDLIVMKAVAHRPRDLGDIDTMLAVHTTLDRRRIRRLAGMFAETLEMPEIIEDLERLLRKRRR